MHREGDTVVIRNAAGAELRSLAGSAELRLDHPQADHPYLQALLQQAAMALGLSA